MACHWPVGRQALTAKTEGYRIPCDACVEFEKSRCDVFFTRNNEDYACDAGCFGKQIEFCDCFHSISYDVEGLLRFSTTLAGLLTLQFHAPEIGATESLRIAFARNGVICIINSFRSTSDVSIQEAPALLGIGYTRVCIGDGRDAGAHTE